MTSETKGLIETARQGRAAAIEELLVRHRSALAAYIRLRRGAVVRAKEDTEDIVQSVAREVLEKQLEKYEYRGDAAFRAWLFNAAAMKLSDRLKFYHAQKRDIGREAHPVADGHLADAGVREFYATIASPSSLAMAAEEASRIEAAFDELPADYREIICLRRVVGMSLDEIAEKLGKTSGATRVALSRAMARLSILLANSPPAPSSDSGE